ncbi:MAG: glycosyltransferase family 1 protein [Tissierellia bacterium]|nr:glycosyltransferase family 1 protein [Tissierellia bacterium]
MIKVLHVVSALDGGGVENLLLNYYNYMDKKKIKFDFIVHGNNKGALEPIFENLNSKIYHIPSKHDSVIQNFKCLKEIIYNGNYDIVHAHLGIMSVFPVYYAKKAGVAIRIAHSHTAFITKSISNRLIHNILRPFLKRNANYWFACSEDAGEFLWGSDAVTCGRVHIMKNAIDINKFTFNPEVRNKIRNVLGVEGKFVIGSVGRFTYSKNHKFLIQIFNEIYNKNRDATLILIGNGELEDEIKKQIISLGLKDVVICLGVRDDVHELLQAMDVFLLPTRYEGFGIVYIEAQTAGLMTFGSEKVVPSEVKITDLMKFISLNNSPESWCKEILGYNNGYKRVDTSKYIKENGYDIQLEANKLEKFYYKSLTN